MTLHWPRLHILLGCSLLLAVTACSTPPIVEKKAAGKLPGPGTYAWQDPVADAGDFSGNPVAQMSAAAAADIRQAIDATLQQRGYRQRPPGEAAWRVSYQAKTETRTEDIAPDDKMLMPRMVCGLHDCNIVQEWQAFGPPQYAETQRSYRESTLRIELHDARSGEVVWRGSVSRELDGDEHWDMQALHHSIVRLLQRLPAVPAKPPAPAKPAAPTKPATPATPATPAAS